MPTFDEILRNNLTDEQRNAVVDPAPEVITLACAGSGKSRTLAFRIMRLLSEGADPRSIVAFTFTEKAAESIKLQSARALGAAEMRPTLIGAMYIGTIHSYCQYVLGEMDADYHQFEVLDPNRLKLFLMSRYIQLGLQTLRQQRGNARYFDVIREVASAWQILNDELIPLNEITLQDQTLGNILQNLSDLMRIDRFIDFSLMIRRVAEALRQNEAGALRAVSNLQHLMVDEYQDVNPAQETLIRELHRLSATLFVVGDDDQAIYAWRGADVNNILTFQDRYPNCSQHTLELNFRSTDAIVQSASSFAAAELGATRITKNPAAEASPNPRHFCKLWFLQRAYEADWVASRIERLLGTEFIERNGTVRGLTAGDFAILMRSTRQPEQNGTPRHDSFTQRLSHRQIPYSLEAGGSIFDRPQVEALRETFELLRNGNPDRNLVQLHFQNVVIPSYPNADLNRLASVLNDWGRRIFTPISAGGTRRRVYPQMLVHELLDAFRISMTALDDGTLQDLGIFSRIIQDVETVYVSIDDRFRFQDILNFLSNVAEDGYDTGTEDILRPDAVTVSTVHKMKGLEFPVVFVVDVEARRFPKSRSNYSGWLPSDVIQPAINRGAYVSTPNEEARLFYTALTRAERYLHVTGSENLPAARRTKRQSVYFQRLSHPELNTDPAVVPAGLTPSTPVRRVDETIVPTSYSDIRYFLRCPHDFKLRKMFGFSPPIQEMFGFGRTVHAAVCKVHEEFPETVPNENEAEEIARRIFHLKHVPQSRDPINRPGGYERAQDSAASMVRTYTGSYSSDFSRRRQVEIRFEVPVTQAVISGSIDLMLKEDDRGNVLNAEVIDFKAMEGGKDPEENKKLEWTDMSLQVQLYAKAARDVLGENAQTGSVHLLKDNQRIDIPIDEQAIDAAVANVEWAVQRMLENDYPMRPSSEKCEECDFKALCSKRPEDFLTTVLPPPIRVPSGIQMTLAFREFERDEE